MRQPQGSYEQIGSVVSSHHEEFQARAAQPAAIVVQRCQWRCEVGGSGIWVSIIACPAEEPASRAFVVDEISGDHVAQRFRNGNEADAAE